MNKKTGKRIIPYLLILPNLSIYFAFIFVPVLWVLYLSFTDYNVLSGGGFIGLENYEKMFQDTIFLQAVKNTIIYWIFTVIPQMLIGLILANFLNAKLKAVSLFRAGIYLPAMLSSVVVAMAWLWLYDPLSGPLNSILNFFGMESVEWLKEPQYALMSVIIVGIWVGIGFSMIIYLAGLQGISEDLYEAASIDGASKFRQFISITIPQLRPMTFFLFVTSTIKSFQVFDLVYVMTQGGPVNSTNTIVNEVISTAFQRYEMGYASAFAVFLLLLTLLITLVNYKFGSKEAA